jgi:hypothetical protein
MSPETMEIHLPPQGKSTELLRKFRVPGFHGELVVTLSSQGKMELTVYPEDLGSSVEKSRSKTMEYRIL